MNAFNLNRLNLRSPYHVIMDDEGDLFFETDFGVSYGISFDENNDLLNYPTFEFGIYNRNGRPSPNDVKLRDTVLAIIEEFFTSNDGVFLYICATGDGMQAYRYRLFLRWFSSYTYKDNYLIRTIEGVMDDDTPNYGAIIIRKSHPDLELVMMRFDELVKVLKK